MRRQLRAKGGIMNVAPREKFGLGSSIKKRLRKLIPNEVADVAVKAAPFIAPFYPGYAAIARGLGRFDQRGSISDALKQGAATYAGGKAIGFLGGAQSDPGILGRQRFSMEGFKKGPVGKRLFKETPTLKDNVPPGIVENTPGSGEFGGSVEKIATKPREGLKVVQKGVDFVKEKIPMLENLPDDVAQKLLVGGITGGASALYSYFTGEFEPQQPGESMQEYLARRKTRVKQQMRGYMDSYYTPLRNPQYAAMSDEEKNNYIDSIVGQGMATGGRVEFNEGSGDPSFIKNLVEENLDKVSFAKFGKPYGELELIEKELVIKTMKLVGAQTFKKDGGRVGLMGGAMPMGEPRVNQGGITELDYRAKGGFVPVGIKEKADDVPAMLSKNEFVFTADAVRGAGNGSVEKGAQKMYDTMKNLERRVT